MEEMQAMRLYIKVKNSDSRRNSKVFYVGKGRGNRVFAHVNCVVDSANKSDICEIMKKAPQIL